MIAQGPKWIAVAIFLSTVILLPQDAATKTEAVVVDPDLAIREEMVAISRQLGVTCTHCHDAKNFKSQTLPTFGIAKEHMRVVSVLNSKEGFAGKPKVDCYMCHRGEPKPPFQEAHGEVPKTAAAAPIGKAKNPSHAKDEKAEKH